MVTRFPDIAISLSRRLRFPKSSCPLANGISITACAINRGRCRLRSNVSCSIIFAGTNANILLANVIHTRTANRYSHYLRPTSFSVTNRVRRFCLFRRPRSPRTFRSNCRLLNRSHLISLNRPVGSTIIVSAPFIILYGPSYHNLYPAYNYGLGIRRYSYATRTRTR